MFLFCCWDLTESLRERPICRLIYIFSHPNSTQSTKRHNNNKYFSSNIFINVYLFTKRWFHVLETQFTFQWLEEFEKKNNCATPNSVTLCKPCLWNAHLSNLILGQCVKSAQKVLSERRPQKNTLSIRSFNQRKLSYKCFFHFSFMEGRSL